MNFLAADVPDPTDFPAHGTAPGLRTLDGSFRCNICGDLYDAPVTIACGHCFCSSCVRDALDLKKECPSCRKSAGEQHIRPNPALENAIQAWKEARPFILGLLAQDKERISVDSQTRKGAAKKRKRSSEPTSSADKLEDNGNVAGPSRRALSPNGADNVTPKPHSRVKKAKHQSDAIVIPSSDIEEDQDDENPTAHNVKFAPQQNDLVACPMCQKELRFKNLNSHMDNNCKDSGTSADTAATSWSKIMGGGSKKGNPKGKLKKRDSDSDDEHPLPLSTYSTLKDKQLKDMLAEHKLPQTGDRTIWEQRHQRWVVLYNSNLDKSIHNRKTKAELRKDLKKLEEDMKKKKKTVIKDPVGYQIEQKAEFARLIQEAKSSRMQASSTPKTTSYSSSQSIPSSNIPIPYSSSTEPGDTIIVDSEEERTHDL